MSTTTIINSLKEEQAQNLFTNNKFLTIGTGTAVIADDATSLTAGTAIGSTFAKEYKSGTSGSYVEGSSVVLLWDLGPSEPVTQPLNIGELGVKKTSGTVADLRIGAKLNAVQTKDTSTKDRIRCTVSVKSDGDL
ncbi:MAG: hypothetical protein MI802_05695 [Desulfobacterales bacterium]|nr:hypothetical protein [Desulfobacterales bacterium]